MRIFKVVGHRKSEEISYEDAIASIGSEKIPDLETAAEENRKKGMRPPDEYVTGLQVFASVINEAGEVFIPISEDSDE